MDIFEREKEIQKYIRERDIAFHEKAKQYEWDYMTNWSESDPAEKYRIAASCVDRRLMVAEIRDFMLVLAEKMGLDYIDSSEINGKPPCNSLFEKKGFCAAISIKNPDVLALLPQSPAYSSLNHEMKENIGCSAYEGGELLIALLIPKYDGLEFACESETASGEKARQDFFVANKSPLIFLANMLQPLVEKCVEKEDSCLESIPNSTSPGY